MLKLMILPGDGIYQYDKCNICVYTGEQTVQSSSGLLGLPENAEKPTRTGALKPGRKTDGGGCA